MKNQREMPFYTDVFLDEVLGVEGIPPRLYHYTSVDTFALILKNRTIRFNRLDKVNDAEEAMAEDLPRANTTQFVSCWTTSSAESIPLWNMYTGMTGVRICVPVDMFKGRPNPEVFDHGGLMTFLNEHYSIDRIRRNTGEPFFGVGSKLLFGPNPVFYSDCKDYLCPSVLFDAGDPYKENIKHVGLNTIDLGCVKGTAWAFEKEWRFKMSIFGIGEVYPLDTIGNMKLDFISNPVSTEFVDVALDAGVFDEMRITLAPHISETDKARVKQLLQSYAPKVLWKHSGLKIRKP